MKLEDWMRREGLSASGLVKKMQEAGTTLFLASIRRFLEEGKYLHPKNEEAIVRLTKGKVGYADLRPYIRGGKGKAA